MVSIYKTDNIKSTEEGRVIYGELRGLSTDAKPTKIGTDEIGNGCVFLEIDTQKLSFYDGKTKTWKEVE